MSKQSSIDWFYDKIKNKKIGNGQILFDIDTLMKEFEQAKAMHKQEIVEAHGVKESHGAEGSRNLWQQTTGEQYYKEQYERENNKH